MKRIAPFARMLLGLVFVVFSTNYFVPFLPPQPMPPQPALALAGALMASGLLTLIKVIELVAGLALLANRAVPLALALLAPIIVGIGFFHLVLAPAGAPLALGVLALELVLAWSYRNAFRTMVQWRVAPASHAVTTEPPSELAIARG
ncbi:MAG: DoxX family protein [Kofleriaceae bacterium]